MTPSRLITRIVTLIIATGFAVFGVIMLVHTLHVRSVQDETPTWPQASGEVLVSRLSVSRGRRGRKSHSVDIQYQYEAEGQMRRARSWYYRCNDVTSADEGNRVLASFAVGTKVPVYYNPSDPNEAVLVTGRAPTYQGGWQALTLGFPALMGVIGVGLAGGTILRWNKLRAKEKTA